MQDLSDSDFKLMESILLAEFQKETEQNKQFNGYSKSAFTRANAILSCIRAISSQRELKEKLSQKW
jgi:hypothetical protein